MSVIQLGFPNCGSKDTENKLIGVRKPALSLSNTVSLLCRKKPPEERTQRAGLGYFAEAFPLAHQVSTEHSVPHTVPGTSSLPFPFCHVVYQDRVRNEVTNANTVATVPFRSLISFHHHTGSHARDNSQTSLSSATSQQNPERLVLVQKQQLMDESHFRCRAEVSSAATQAKLVRIVFAG